MHVDKYQVICIKWTWKCWWKY